jgi:xanthine dehydrogenase accessory factor
MGVSLWATCDALSRAGTSFIMVTMTAVRGSAPQEVGAKMIVTSAGLAAGTIGGGKVEFAAISKARELLAGASSPPVTVVWNLQTDIGMSCGGEVTLLFEHHHQKNWPVVIFGAGHVAQALTRLLANLRCQVTCVDPREEWINRLDGVLGILHPSPKDLVATFSKQSFFLSMTMGHAHDVPILREIARHAPDAPYVGVIGSEVKGIKIKRELRELGVAAEFLEKLRVPMGLPLGNNEPWEIAVSITAELLKVRDEHQG